jgi:hypothetical protein
MRRLLPATALLIGLWSHSAAAQTCPAAIPNPADAFAVDCFTVNKPTGVRCATAIDPTVCATLNDRALNANLLTADGYNELNAIRFCAISGDFGIGLLIYDFCPAGCFAADTQVATSVSPDGKPDYVAAASVTPRSPLVSMADDASLSQLALAPQSVKRTVAGPEDANLFVFGLANGRTLRVTQHHPMVIDSGQILQASQVVPGMAFVGLDGKSVAISSITREKPTANVFNFLTGGDTQLSHIIIAEGVLVGDLKIQNDLENEQTSVELRR